VKLKTTERTTVDFVSSVVVTSENIRAVVQVAKPELLNVNEIDWSLRYVQIHSKDLINLGQYVEYQGSDYKIITPSNYQDYGFSEVIGEQVRGDVV
jgi:NAD(P)H-nitrite reductase large subunit